MFRGEQYDLNLTLFSSQQRLQKPSRGSGVFVVSNGAGVAANTVDQLCSSVCIAGMIDLKQDFSEAKIAASFEMVLCVRPDLDALVINMISGLAVARDTVAAVERFCQSVEGRVPVILRFTAPDPGDNEAVLHSLERRHDSVTLAHSTRNLVEKTIELLAPGSAPARRDTPHFGPGARHLRRLLPVLRCQRQASAPRCSCAGRVGSAVQAR